MGAHDDNEPTGAEYFKLHAGIALDDVRDPVEGFDAAGLEALRSAGTAYAVDAARHARHAERHALALLDRELSAEDRAAILEGLRFHNASKERLRDAEALARYQAGEPVWAWPARAPWAGFGVAS